MTREDKLRKAIEEYIGYPCKVDECINTTKRRIAFADGANWQYHEFINKACKYLLTHIDKDLVIYHEQSWKSLNQFIVDFRKAMEE